MKTKIVVKIVNTRFSFTLQFYFTLSGIAIIISECDCRYQHWWRFPESIHRASHVVGWEFPLWGGVGCSLYWTRDHGQYYVRCAKSAMSLCRFTNFFKISWKSRCMVADTKMIFISIQLKSSYIFSGSQTNDISSSCLYSICLLFNLFSS